MHRVQSPHAQTSIPDEACGPGRTRASASGVSPRLHPPAHVLRSGPIRVDLDRKTVSVSGRRVPLNGMEFRLIKALIEAHGRTLSCHDLILVAWQGRRSADLPTRLLELHLRRLKAKLRTEGHRISAADTVDYYFGEATNPPRLGVVAGRR